jgi:hypothetical protein
MASAVKVSFARQSAPISVEHPLPCRGDEIRKVRTFGSLCACVQPDAEFARNTKGAKERLRNASGLSRKRPDAGSAKSLDPARAGTRTAGSKLAVVRRAFILPPIFNVEIPEIMKRAKEGA